MPQRVSLGHFRVTRTRLVQKNAPSISNYSVPWALRADETPLIATDTLHRIEAAQAAHHARKVGTVADGDDEAYFDCFGTARIGHLHIFDSGVGAGNLAGDVGQQAAAILGFQPQFGKEIAFDLRRPYQRHAFLRPPFARLY